MAERGTLTFAGLPYWDRVLPLVDGTIGDPGFDLRFIPFDGVGDLFRRVAMDAEFETAEFSLSTLTMLRSRGDDRMRAIPVFLSRAFRHSQLYIRADAGISSPEDLRGRRVGIPEYQMTAALWIRGILQHDHGVSPDRIDWVSGGLRSGTHLARAPHGLPDGVRMAPLGLDMGLEQALVEGHVDALVTAREPLPFLAGDPRVERMFPDYQATEREWFRRTGCYPIMHAVVVRADVRERDPSVCVRLLDAFEAARRAGAHRLRDLDTLAVMHPWIASSLAEVEEFFGQDPYSYGVGPNLRTLRMTTRLSFEQGLSDRLVDPEELFWPEVLDWSPSSVDPSA